MNNYEGIFIVSPDLGSEQLQKSEDLIKELIDKEGGTIDQVDRWGKKPLAHAIKKFNQGQFIYTQFKLDPLKVKELQHNLKIREEILQSMITSVTGKKDKEGTDGGS